MGAYDYSLPGVYFITICTDNRKALFSQIVGAHHDAPLQGRSVIAKCIGYLKANVTKTIRRTEPDAKIWQRRFYDHVIRNEKDYSKHWDYIEDNPAMWVKGRHTV